MKRLFFVFATLVLFYQVSLGHPINGYKYVVIEQKGNVYDIEDMLAVALRNVGFTVLANGEEDGMVEQKHLILHVDYDGTINYNGPSTLMVTLTNTLGNVVYKSITDGMTLLSVKGDMSKAISKMEFNLKKLQYKFEAPSADTNPNSGDFRIVNLQVDCAKWSADSIKNYLRNKNVNSIEGIYKNLSGEGFSYRFAIVKEKEMFYGIIIDSNSKLWKKGDIKLTLSHIERNIFDIELFDARRIQTSCLGEYSNRILEISADDSSMKFVKTFPNTNTENSSNENTASEEVFTSMGSGILISGRVVATNYHVIENAEVIKISLNDKDGRGETYNGRILCIDRTNDLALLTIKDSKFSEREPAPFSLARSNIDVGSSIFTMGYPLASVLGDELKVTDGIISSNSGYEGDITTYQISAPLQPGNSGGALFDRKGHLVGITSAGVSSAENIGYAIKTSYLLNLIDSSPIEIVLPSGGTANDDLPTMIKKFKPYIAIIKIY